MNSKIKKREVPSKVVRMEKDTNADFNISEIEDIDDNVSEDKESKMSELNKYGSPKFLEDIYILSRHSGKDFHSDLEEKTTPPKNIDLEDININNNAHISENESIKKDMFSSSHMDKFSDSETSPIAFTNINKNGFKFPAVHSKLKLLKKAIELNKETIQEDQTTKSATINIERRKSVFDHIKGGIAETGSNIFSAMGKINLKTLFTRSNTDRDRLISLKEYELLNDKVCIVDKNQIKRQSQRPQKLARTSTKLRNLLEKHSIIRQDMKKELIKRVLKKIGDKKKPLRVKCKEYFSGLLLKCSEIKFYCQLWFHIFITPRLPTGGFRLLWDTISFFLIFFDLLYIPLQIGFDIDSGPAMDLYSNLEDVFFLLDILLNFHTSYYKNGAYVTSHKKIAKHYLKFWFWIDAVSSFPYLWFANLSLDNTNDNKGFKLFRITRFLKLIKIFRIMRFKTLIKKIEDYLQYDSVVNAVLSLIHLIGVIILLSHWCACLWHFLGLTTSEKSERSWLYQMDIIHEDITDRYIASLYWATTTMLTVGYGDITPTTGAERIVNIIVMLIGCGLFAFAMNSIGILLQNINAATSKTR